MKDTLRQMLYARKREFPKNNAFVYWKNNHSITEEVTPEAFSIMVECLGEWFLEHGYHKKKIAVFSENSFLWVLTFFAITTSGNIAVLPDYHLDENELEKLLTYTECDCLCYSSTYSDIAGKLNTRINIPSLDTDFLYKTACLKDDNDLDLYNANPPWPDDIAIIAFTSGTSGERKGVELSHRNILSDVVSVASIFEYQASSLQLLPFFHMFGMLALLGILIQGGTVYIEDSLRYAGSDIVNNSFAFLCVVPAMLPVVYQAIKRKPADTAKLPVLLYGGAPAEAKWAELFLNLGIRLYNGYGMTECSPCIAIGMINDRENTSIHILDVNEVMIDRPDEYGVGEILVRGNNVMHGYYSMPYETQNTIINGWLHTGDLGKLDANRLTILGRIKNLLILPNGENISPEAIERKVMLISGITECMLTLENSVLTMKVYAPNAEEASIREEIRILNQSLLPSHRIMNTVFSKEPFQKSAIGKIVRK